MYMTVFCTLLRPSLHDRDMKLPNFMLWLKGAQQFPFSFSKLRHGPFGFNPRKVRQYEINKMKLNKVAEV